MKKITFSEIKPFVRYARRQSFMYTEPVYALDERMIYCVSGSGVLTVSGREYSVKKDSVLLWQSGKEYLFSKSTSFDFIAINFDYTHDAAKKAMPVRPLNKREYSKEKLLSPTYITNAPTLSEVTVIENAGKLLNYFKEIELEYRLKKLLYSEKCSYLLLCILTEIIRTAMTVTPRLSKNRYDEILSYIEDNCTENLSNTHIGQLFSYHPNYVNSLIVKLTGCSLHSYLLQCRIQKAIVCLENGSNVSETAQRCGFNDTAYFSRYFKKITGVSPSKFQNKKAVDSVMSLTDKSR